MNVSLRRVVARLRSPFTSSRGSVRERELLLLSLEDEQGHIGQGEAAPLPSYDGVQLDEVVRALEDCRRLLESATGDDVADPRARAALLDACAGAAVLPQALAAVDLALWDLAGQRAGQPVWQLLGAPEASQVEVNYTISATDRTGAAAEATHAARSGFRCVKAKVGIGDDGGRLAAVRAGAGPETAVRIDANGAWSVHEAHAALRALAPIGIELCEEPVRGPDEIARLSGLTQVPLALDESAAVPGLLEHRVCTAACLKITRCGGITGVLEAARRARKAGYELYLASTLDGPLGIAAALHACAAIRPDRPCGLATLSLFDRHSNPLPASDGLVAVPDGPGLGAGLGGWYGD